MSRLLNGVLSAAVLDRKGRGGALLLSAAAVEVYVACQKEMRPLDPQNEKARRDKASADLAEHRLAVAKGEYLPYAEVEATWSAVVVAVKSKILAVPSFAVAGICRAYQLEGEAGVHNSLRKAMNEVLRELADPDLVDLEDTVPPVKKKKRKK